MALIIDADDDGTLHSIEATGELSWQEELVLNAARQQVALLGIAGSWSDDDRKFTADQ